MTEKEFNGKIVPLTDCIWVFCRHFLKDEDTASDITQDVLMRLWDNRRDLDNIENPKAYAMRIARNLCLDFIKKSKPIYDEETVITNGGYDTDLLLYIQQQDTVEAVRRIIDTLPSSQREVIILRELEEMEYDEISQITGLGINNIRVLLSRARAKVREVLTKQYQTSPYDN